MFTTEVHPLEWASFFERLMSEMPNTWATIEIEAPGTPRQVQAHDMLIENLGYDRRDDVLEVAAFHPGPKGRAVLRHMITAPETVSINSRPGILPSAIEILARDGVRTFVRLHPAPSLSS